MKVIILYLFKVLILIFLNSNSLAEIKYKTYKNLPCKFNNAEVGNSAYPRNEIDKTYKKKFNRCVDKRYGFKPLFYPKDGTSISVKYKTPIFAVTDFEFVFGRDYGAQYRCHVKKGTKGFNKKMAGSMKIKVPDPYNPDVMRKCQKPYDGIELIFKDLKSGDHIRYYHLSSTPVVPGFGVGKCKLPLMKDRTLNHTRSYFFCGGVSKEKFKKGEIIGYSGSAGNKEHFGFNIKRDGKWLIAPEDQSVWESLPTESEFYLLPVMSKKYLKKIGVLN
tara:strand:- start:73 stop:897 length:825 start_codon:yes stop_codon:yes gene_type:complete